MPQEKKENIIEFSDDSQDEGFGSSTNPEPQRPEPQRPPRRSVLKPPQPQVATVLDTPGINASALKWFNENPVLLVLLLGSLLMGMLFHFYKKVDTLQSNIESLREKINQLENLSKENCSLVGGTQTYLSVKTMAKIEDRIENAKNKIDDIVKSIEPIKMIL
ncbi:unnamed protein product [Mytilus edulis]|uniref:Uncharacterized protein n=1 Tax=Mytilus edulis TaxID=6550 RepID=A0A8S3SK18_MYTED|nr:unnamed protein product [Mytilus edulis]